MFPQGVSEKYDDAVRTTASPAKCQKRATVDDSIRDVHFYDWEQNLFILWKTLPLIVIFL